MTDWLPHLIFWLAAACVGYAYVGYPALAAAVAAVRPRPRRSEPGAPDAAGPISVVLACHNEAATIASRVAGLAERIAARPAGGALIVVSDGSTDDTAALATREAERAEAAAGGSLSARVVVLPERRGKAVALNAGVRAAEHPIVIFADARQRWAPDAIDRLVAAFDDPEVGAVSGDLVVEARPGVMAAVGLYWRYEKWLRRNESRFGTMVSVTGSISAVRRELFPELPAGLILDDVYWPLAVIRSGRRVVHEESALAYDRLPDRPRDEFRRKVRTLAGNFQLAALAPWTLSPFRNPAWWPFVSHRMMRLAAPWGLLAMLLIGAASNGGYLRAAFWAQVVCYGIGGAGCVRRIAGASRIAAAAASFLVLNAAAWLAFWVWSTGRSERSWTKVSYVESR